MRDRHHVIASARSTLRFFYADSQHGVNHRSSYKLQQSDGVLEDAGRNAEM
ncbi:MAG: hypothetical protein ABIW79_08315 [Gemmatimonas sp.]